MMSAVLRLTLLVLWACYACGASWYPATSQRSAGHYHRPHDQTHNYNYPTYNHHYPSYQKSPCSAETPCYEQMLTYTRDAIPDRRPNPHAFIDHYKRAGFDKYAIIEEGKRAAKFFYHKYGVDVGYLPDEAYLAPNITLASGMRFTFSIPVLPTGKGLIGVVTQGAAAQFINAPASVALWSLSFPADYYSNGAFKGHIPARSSSSFGSYIFDTCPDESAYSPCRSTLSRKPKGRVIIKFRSRRFQTSGLFDSDLVHEEWGEGHLIGAWVATADGVAHARYILTFPKSCDSNAWGDRTLPDACTELELTDYELTKRLMKLLLRCPLDLR